MILFDLDLKIYLNGLENKCKRKEKKEEKLTCCQQLGGLLLSACSSPSLLLGQAGPSLFSPLFPTPAWAGPRSSRGHASLSPVSLTGRTRLSAAPSSSRPNRAGHELNLH
jgi:hypothetical protein